MCKLQKHQDFINFIRFYGNHEKVKILKSIKEFLDPLVNQFFLLLIFFIIFFTYIKISKDSSAKCYQNNKERLQKKSRKNIEVFPNKKKDQQYRHERYKNLSEDKKQRLVEYKKRLTNV